LATDGFGLDPGVTGRNSSSPQDINRRSKTEKAGAKARHPLKYLFTIFYFDVKRLRQNIKGPPGRSSITDLEN
jgi:hypothetical protein